MDKDIRFPKSLEAFRHGYKTDIAKRTMTNQDATALIMYENGGTMRVGDIRKMLLHWRFGMHGEPTHTPGFQYRYMPKDPRANEWGQVKVPAMHPRLCYTYLFNTTHGRFGGHGYGFVGRDEDSTHNTLSFHGQESWAYRLQREAHERGERVDWSKYAKRKDTFGRTFRRRTLWYRRSRGVYSLTHAAFARVSELTYMTLLHLSEVKSEA